MAIDEYFSADYAEARMKFLDVTRTAGASITSLINPSAKGPADETLAVDVARFGPAEAENLFVTGSGTHGAEGFAGSGCQIGSIMSGQYKTLPANTAYLLIHALNPYGFAWLRRVTEGNVDLNRNFIDWSKSPPANTDYDRIAELVVPSDWSEATQAASLTALLELANEIGLDRMQGIEDYIRDHGLTAFQAAVTGGQYSHADGLFYGGAEPSWSNLTLQNIVEGHGRGCKRIAFVDFHTGLGPTGHGEALYPGPTTDLAHARAQMWYGDDVTSTDAGTSSSAIVNGTVMNAFDWKAPEAEFTGIGLEFGTQPALEVLNMLRADNWLHLHGDPVSDAARAFKAQFRATFYVDTPEWKQSIYQRAEEITAKAFTALGA